MVVFESSIVRPARLATSLSYGQYAAAEGDVGVVVVVVEGAVAGGAAGDPPVPVLADRSP